MRVWTRVLLALFIGVWAVPAAAQSLNTATVVITVTDQNGGVLKDAAVAVQDAATGVSRDGTSDANGTLTVPSLDVNGTYSVTVKKSGFADGTTAHITLRAGEVAQVRMKLLVGGGASEVTVYGTAEGVRTDPELGTRLDSDRIEDTPILGRKFSALPLLNAAFRNAKGTGDLFMNSVYFVTGAGGRRQADFALDGATADELWGRQTMFATVPISAIAEMNIESRAFSAEYGWTSSAAVNIVTKSGSNDLHGDGLFIGRPGGLQPKTFSAGEQCAPSVGTCVAPTTNGVATPIVPPDIPDSLGQGSFSLGGAIAKDRTYYFMAGDFTNQNRTAAITSPVLVPAGETSIGYIGTYQQGLFDGRLDHRISNTNSLMVRFNLDRFYDNNPQDTVGGNVLPDAGREFIRHSYSGQVNETAILSSSLLNEARFEYQDADPVTDFTPLDPSTQITRSGAIPFTDGTSLAVDVFSRQTSFSDTMTWTKSRHDIRFGGAVTRSSSGGNGTEFGNAFVLGQFTANSSTTAAPSALTIANMTKYQQSFNFGQGTYVLDQWVYDVFVQDSYRPVRDVTLDLGLRYDRQTFSQGKKNVAPRVGFAWNPNGSPKLSVRGGYGIYYTELRANNDASFTLGGPQGQFTYTAAPGQTGFPTCVGPGCTPVLFNQNAALNTLPARNITIEPGLASYYESLGVNVAALPGYAAATFVNPKSQVGSIGFERQIGGHTFLSVDYVRQHWTGLDETVDLNAPSLFVRTAPDQCRGPNNTAVPCEGSGASNAVIFADLTRPIVPVNGGFRVIDTIENLGIADYNGLQTMLRWQDAASYLSISYTLSKATNTTEPDGNGAGPNDFNQLGPANETAPSLLDQRHRAVIVYSRRLPWNVTAGTVNSLASSKPFNPTTGVDNNGDGSSNDRPVINGVVVGRYSFRGTPTYDTDVFLEKGVKLSARTLALRMECFNLFNHANILGRNGTYGNGATPIPTFGVASSGLSNVDPGRMFQFELRFQF
jgi:Carboxypeptidase regulatory-like domain